MYPIRSHWQRQDRGGAAQPGRARHRSLLVTAARRAQRAGPTHVWFASRDLLTVGVRRHGSGVGGTSLVGPGDARCVDRGDAVVVEESTSRGVMGCFGPRALSSRCAPRRSWTDALDPRRHRGTRGRPPRSRPARRRIDRIDTRPRRPTSSGCGCRIGPSTARAYRCLAEGLATRHDRFIVDVEAMAALAGPGGDGPERPVGPQPATAGPALPRSAGRRAHRRREADGCDC